MRRPAPPRPCADCGAPTLGALCRGRCKTCYGVWYQTVRPRATRRVPCACGRLHWPAAARCTVCAYAAKRGVRRFLKPHFWTPARDDVLEALYTAGVPLLEIAAALQTPARALSPEAIKVRACVIGARRPKARP